MGFKQGTDTSRCTFSRQHRGSNVGNELQGSEGTQEAIWNLLSPRGSWEATGKMATGMNDSDREERCKRWNQQDVMTHGVWEETGKEAGGCVGRT